MLAEHTFITTREQSDAIQTAQAYLHALGYRRAVVERGPDAAVAVTMTRGRPKPNTSNMAELPQRVTIHFDRGRVMVAAAIHERGKVMPLHRELVLAVASSIEQVLAHDVPFDEARAPFDRVIARMAHRYQ